MECVVLDIEKPPPEKLYTRFGVVLSTNCIHATRTCFPGGIGFLVEFTKNMLWFGMVFGLLEGWWLFSDGRDHVLADEAFWEQSMKGAGFEHVAMTGGSSKEAKTVRIITAFTEEAKTGPPQSWIRENWERSAVETVAFDTPDGDSLLIHGGVHVMLSRKGIRPKEVKHLLQHGVLPISVDYRLCPAANILHGPMTDVLTAYKWVRTLLPSLKLKASPILDIDSDRVAVVGWSTRGTLALSSSWAVAEPQSVKVPDVILAFCSPTDYQDECKFRLIRCYHVPPSKRATGGWMCPSDPRSDIILCVNWRGEMLPVLRNGLPSPETVRPDERHKFECLPLPLEEEITRFGPYAQIVSGAAQSPTYIVHGTKDDLIPWQQSVRTYEALQNAGIASNITILQDQPHLFNLFSDVTGENWQAVEKAYEFVLQRL
ncbi:Alpha/Beta hydrolase protein [Clohesyomyces aquaticus]|uniref:Alpha/Beta hydrolase protein n=1 Tax=Clohesyomyces aquaticus TaxID=1231657 RepID=A0A1Y1Y6F9_9PLEO|nr:Alpha/Beta hydrolase protein [Clohesyomyces aquaticus]